jgi:vitamin B12 transporter
MRTALLLSTALVAAAAAPAWAYATEPAPPAAPAPAADVAGTEAANALDGVVISAGRREEAASAVGQAVTVLTLPEIRASQALIVSDLLARTPGVQVSRTGGPGQATSVRIRGAETDQTVVLIDGVKLNDPSSTGGGYNFADLLVDDTARIEVLRGPQSTLYGSQAIGGVVSIVTAAPTTPLAGDAQVEGGSYSTGYAKAAVGGRQGGFTARAAISTYLTDGVSAFDSRRGGKEADGYHNTAVTGRVGYEVSPDLSLDGRIYYAEARNSFDGYAPPTYAFGDTPEFGRTQELVAYAGANLGLLDGRLKNRFAAQYTDTERQNLNPTQAVTPYTFEASGKNTRVEYQGVLALAPGWTATFGAERERSSFSNASPSAFSPNPKPIKSAVAIDSGYGQVTAEVIPHLTLTGGVRYDAHDTFGGHTTGQASAAYALNGGATILRASYGSGFKAPTLYQLYSPYGSAGLKPESAEGFDGGVEQSLFAGRLKLQVTGFSRDSENLIGFFSCPYGGTPTGRCVAQPYGYYANTAKSRARGVELSGSATLTDRLSVTGNYTYTDAEDRSPGATFGKALVRRPKDTADLEASYRFPLGVTAAVAAQYVGPSFENAANTYGVKGYTLVDLRGSYPLGRGLELYGRVENLFDRAYETVYSYGTLGRAAYVGLRASF